MLTVMVSVNNIVAGIASKKSLWEINTDQKYYEEKKPQPTSSDSTVKHDEAVSYRGLAT